MRYSDQIRAGLSRIESRWGRDFSAPPDRPWGPRSLLYNGYRVFPGGRGGRGVELTPPLQCRVPRKSIAIPLLTLRACVAYKKGETYLIVMGDATIVKPVFTSRHTFCRISRPTFAQAPMVCVLGFSSDLDNLPIQTLTTLQKETFMGVSYGDVRRHSI